MGTALQLQGLFAPLMLQAEMGQAVLPRFLRVGASESLFLRQFRSIHVALHRYRVINQLPKQTVLP